MRRLDSLRSLPIPPGLSYAQLSLRREAQERLARAAPHDLAEVANIPGLTPADIATVHAAICRHRTLSQPTTQI